jgi:hypothetical protein
MENQVTRTAITKSLLTVSALLLAFCFGLMTPKTDARAQATQLCASVPTAQTQRVLDGVAGAYNYQATVPDAAHPGQTLANPETKAQYVRRMLVSWVRESVRGYEATQAGEAARSSKAAEADALNIQ